MCTGETATTLVKANLKEVYPHVYGGNRITGNAIAERIGLSPCVRGKRFIRLLHRGRRRSIPMCTGETRLPVGRLNVRQVYPHVYGGNDQEQVEAMYQTGLSPCVRGKPAGYRQGATIPRSIPMCTGETRLPVGRLNVRQVYPHVYGGN